MSGLILLAQAAATNPAPQNVARPPDWLTWLIVWGEPAYTLGRTWGGVVSWSKVVGLYCLMAWVVAWLITSARTRSDRPGAKASSAKLITILGALVAGVLAALLNVLEDTGRVKLVPIAGTRPGMWLGIVSGLLLVMLVELQLWGAILRRGSKADLVCLVAMHVVFVLGYFTAYQMDYWNQLDIVARRARGEANPESLYPDWRGEGGRIGGTFMGLVVLLRVFWLLKEELTSLRFRRIYSIAWQSVAEANRTGRAPWVVSSVFIVILAFTHWFLRSDSDDRAAELSRVFVGTLALLCSILLALMIIFVAPVSMPRDIQNQTIYTIVSKPVRRLELIWGRLLGYMGLVTVLLIFFGAISIVYVERIVGYRITAARDEARKFETSRPDHAKLKEAQADQLESRMSARVPLKGSLVFQDAKNKEHERGIDVGQEQEMRTFVEGATESRAVWRYELVRDRFAPGGLRDLRVPVESLLRPGTIEAVEDHILNLRDEIAGAGGPGGSTASDIAKKATDAKAKEAEVAQLQAELDALRAKEKAVQDRIRGLPAAQRRAARRELDELHSPAIPVEMTFTVYRTTKGVIGEPVLASLRATNPRPGMRPYDTVLPIREYYTNRASIPSRVLVGSHGMLNITVRCVTANQYLGMAESDFYILAGRGGFRLNFLKGLFGIWLQVMVLTAIGLFAGTFLSWPVALLTTLFFFVAGEVAFTYLAQFAMSAQDVVVIGPFESLIRLLGHQNMQLALAPTPAVVVAKTADALVMPVMSRLVYLVPNFGALDVTETVAEGFAVTWAQIRDLTLMGLGYALPFSLAGYFILKNREVAA